MSTLDSSPPGRFTEVREKAPWLLLALLPGAVTVYLAFHGGGYFAGDTAKVAIALLLVLLVRSLLSRDGVAGLTRPAIVAALALALFACWTLLSGTWSQSSGRALIEFDRALLYAVAFVLFGSLGGGRSSLAWVLRGLALAALIVCAVALTTRLLPGLWPIDYDSISPRLSYPVTYWNALGLLAALGIVLCFALTANEREPKAVRVAAAGALPVLSSALLLTLSRGAIAVAIAGLLTFALVAWPRGLLGGLLSGGLAAIVAAASSYGAADLLASGDILSRAARDQGEKLALIVGACAIGALLVRTLLLALDEPLAAAALGERLRRRARLAACLVVAIVLGAGAIAADLPRQWDRFTQAGAAVTDPAQGNLRDRLDGVGDSGRIEHWRVALDGFERAPAHGRGAGTFELAWAADRPDTAVAKDGHSLYLEVLGELGVIGLALLACAVASILVGIVLRLRGPDRALHATVLAACSVWAIAAGIDWHWEMPVVTLPFFALAGAALASRGPGNGRPAVRLVPRVAVAGACCLLVLVAPARLAISQDRLETSLTALVSGRCETAETAAAESLDALPSRPQPYAVRAYCAFAGGRDRLATDAMRDALHRDPQNWVLHYSLARLQALSGQDPRIAVRAALLLNPRDPLVREAHASLLGARGASQWRLAARRMDIVLPEI